MMFFKRLNGKCQFMVLKLYCLALIAMAVLFFPSQVLADRELILIINVDTLRYDAMEAYGNTKQLMPNLDKLTKEKGLCFDYAFASSNHTRPSVVSFFTGLYPTKHGFWDYKSHIIKSKPNLATILPKEYKTFYINANPNTSHIFKEDFDYFWSSYPDKDPLHSDSAYYPAEYIFEKARGFLSDANFPEKTFIYIQPADPHSPYYPLKDYPDLFIGDKLKDKYSGKYRTYLEDLRWSNKYFKKTEREIFPKITSEELINLKNRYDAEVRYFDEQFQPFWEFINDKYHKILFVFTSDHGESFLDHRDAGHGNSLYNEQIKIPLIVFDTEKRFGKSRHSNILISNVDILPTIADIVGYQGDLSVDGESILKLIKNQKRLFPLKKERLIVSEYRLTTDTLDFDAIEDEQLKEELVSYQKEPLNVLIRATIKSSASLLKFSVYKFLENKNPLQTEMLEKVQSMFPKQYFFHRHHNELYRLDTDARESNNLADEESKIIKHLKRFSPLKDIYPEFYRSTKKIDDETLRTLKSLGYVK